MAVIWHPFRDHVAFPEDGWLLFVGVLVMAAIVEWMVRPIDQN